MPAPRTLTATGEPLSPLAINLAMYRKMNNLTQRELAAKVGVNSTHIARIELGSYHPSVTLIPKLMAVFNISADELLCPLGPTEREIHHMLRHIRDLPKAKRDTVTLMLAAFASGQDVRLVASPLG